MKRKFILLPIALTALAPAISLVGCGQDPKPGVPTNIILNEDFITLYKDDTFTLIPTIEPQGATCDLIWTSSLKSVATVDNGVVTAIGPGDATITVKAVGFEGVEATCNVNVTELTTCLTITALEDSTFLTYSTNQEFLLNLSYSLNGSAWTPYVITLGLSKTSVSLPKGSTLQLKGSNLEHGFSKTNLLFTGKVALSGTVMSLVYNDKLTTNVPCKDCFERLFSVGTSPIFDQYHNSIVSAEDLILPDTNLSDVSGCYESMFFGNYELKTAPRLPATKLSSKCYYNLFGQCYSLHEIQLNYTGDFIYDYFEYWVDGLPNDGVLYYNGDDTNNFGSHAIPGTETNHWEVKTFRLTNKKR